MKLLLVEDNEQLNNALTTILKRNSYVVDSVFDGEEAMTLIEEYTYDVIILDIMIPKINGLEVLKRARAMNIESPILMLTAKSTTEDKVSGLNLGADDYLAKPFNVDELLARLKALTRRRPVYEDNNMLEYGDLKLDLSSMTLSCGKEKIVLMNKEFQIMNLLFKSKDEIVSLDKIVANAWNIDEYSTSENVWVFISYLRKKLESIKSKTKIKSIRYQGYYLEYKDDKKTKI
ncbi:MAG: response regulator transcription factor [Gammaproteobacteria bacterium]|nr:response regulator transcription factor [Gammaproteobacteria bacterium]